jgi:hypothetical protein
VKPTLVLDTNILISGYLWTGEIWGQTCAIHFVLAAIAAKAQRQVVDIGSLRKCLILLAEFGGKGDR